MNQERAWEKIVRILWTETCSGSGLPSWDSLTAGQKDQIILFSRRLRRKARMEMIVAYYRKKKEENEQIQ